MLNKEIIWSPRRKFWHNMHSTKHSFPGRLCQCGIRITEFFQSRRFLQLKIALFSRLLWPGWCIVRFAPGGTYTLWSSIFTVDHACMHLSDCLSYRIYSHPEHGISGVEHCPMIWQTQSTTSHFPQNIYGDITRTHVPYNKCRKVMIIHLIWLRVAYTGSVTRHPIDPFTRLSRKKLTYYLSGSSTPIILFIRLKRCIAPLWHVSAQQDGIVKGRRWTMTAFWFPHIVNLGVQM